MRVRKAKQVLNRTDVAVLVTDGTEGRNSVDEELIALFQSKEIPYLIAYNKADLCETLPALRDPAHEIWVSARTGGGIHELKDRIARLSLREEPRKRLVGRFAAALRLCGAGGAYRQGRSQRTSDSAAAADNPGHSGGRCGIHRGKRNGTEKHPEPAGQKAQNGYHRQQVFDRADADTPSDIWLTSFSILFARYKGNLLQAAAGAAALDSLPDSARVLISEGCTHHRQCDDIGTVKLPGWIRRHTGKNIEFSFTSGTEFPEELTSYNLIVHCGGCMLNEREMKYRAEMRGDQGVP